MTISLLQNKSIKCFYEIALDCNCGESCLTVDGVSGICQDDNKTCANNIQPPNCKPSINQINHLAL